MRKINYILIILVYTKAYANCREIELSNNWQLKNENVVNKININGITTPSTVYNELEKHKRIESVLYSKNDVALAWIGDESWNYTFEFSGKIIL